MKNIHLLPTEKPSRLWTNNLRRRLELDEFIEQHPTNIAKHIYITNSEEIKEGDWVKLFVKHIDKEWVHKVTKEDLLLYTDFNNEGSKIILTTDQDLIADGVQAIDDEFLEWFVKNPSCEYVEIEDSVWDGISKWIPYYDIIIPEEPNPCKDIVINDKATIDVPFHNKHIRFENLTSEQAGYLLQVSEFYQLNGVRRSAVVPQEEPKDLAYWKENAEEDYMKVPISVLRYITELEERMYSEEELKNAIEISVAKALGVMSFTINEESFEQFKKK
jgi:hypothetical protein